MSTNSANSLGKNYYIKLAVCIIVPILVMLIPLNDTFTAEMRRYVAVTLFGICMFIFEVAPGPIIALSFAAGYAVFQVASLDIILQSWSHSLVFQGILCIMIMEGVNSTPLLKRISAHLVIRLGGSYLGLLMAISLVSLVVTILIPNTFIVILVIGMGYGLCKSLDLQSGDTAAVGIMMASGLFVCEAQNFLYSPQGIGATAAMISTTIPGFDIGYSEIILDNIIFLPMLVIFPIVFSKIYKPDKPISGVEHFKNELAAMGPLQKGEKNAIIILALMVVYLVSTQWHGYDMAYGFAVAAILLFFPACQVATPSDLKRCDLSLPILIASCMSIGNVGTAVGVSSAVSDAIIPFLQDMDSSFVFVIFTWLSGVICNIFMTPMALYTLLAPILGPIAEALSYSPKIVAYVLYHTGNQVFFPYENNTILMMYAFGMMTMRQFCKGAILKMVIDIVYICAIAVPFWMLLGYL